MCGITGVFGFGARSEQVIRLTEALRHRGPDDGSTWTSQDQCAVLGHRRLSIVDLSPTGAQPMISASGRFVTAFNGEIYNFRELRLELGDLGYRFAGSSDTEVMLTAMEAWGIESTLGKLNGMFAAAVYDQEQSKFFIFRDRLGVKPLYYRWEENRLYLSSELTSAFAGIGENRIDRTALALYFRYNYIPAPHTIYEGVYKLPPGSLAEVTLESASHKQFSRISQYWNSVERINSALSTRDQSLGFQESVDMVEAALAASIKDRIVADVPIGAFLSGGIDSSLVVAHMQRQSSQAVRTFTIGFADAKFDESHHARAIARHLGTNHTELMITEQDALRVIPSLPMMYGEPFADSSQIPTYLVSCLTRQSVTVALSGDGADELFAGYSSYQRLAKVGKMLGFMPSPGYAIAAQFMRSQLLQRWIYSSFGEQRYEWVFNALRLFSGSQESWIPRGLHARLSLPERLVMGIAPGDSILPYRRCQGNITEQMMSHDSSIYLPDDILAKVDRASMAVSLEVRAPFADDWRLFEAAWKIPFRHKASQFGGKLVLKSALERHVPRALFDRPKKGFAIPLGRWLNGPLKDWVLACTDPARIRRDGYLDSQEIENLVRNAKSGDEWYAYKLWAVCLFQCWLADFHGDR